MKTLTDEQLLARIKKILSATYPRPELETFKTQYGYLAGICPECNKKILLRGYGNHWARAHVPKNWKPKQLLALMKEVANA